MVSARETLPDDVASLKKLVREMAIEHAKEVQALQNKLNRDSSGTPDNYILELWIEITYSNILNFIIIDQNGLEKILI